MPQRALVLLLCAHIAHAEPGPPTRVARFDRNGYLLPAGAVARLGVPPALNGLTADLAWTADGTQFVAADWTSITRFDAATGRPIESLKLDTLHRSLFASLDRDGRTLFRATGPDCTLHDAATGGRLAGFEVFPPSLDDPARAVQSLSLSADHRFLAGLLGPRGGPAVAWRYDLGHRKSVRILADWANLRAVRLSPDGRRAYAVAGSDPATLIGHDLRTGRDLWAVKLDRSGTVLGTFGEPDRANLMNPALSPDGRRVAVQRNVQNNPDIWLIDSARTTRFTFDPGRELYPTWSPDGSRIAFASSQADGGLYQRASNGAASSDEQLATGYEQIKFPKFPTDWSKDGLMYFAVNPKTQPDLWVLSMDGDRKPFLFLGTNFSETWGRFSPDGRWVVYQSNESRRFEIYVRPFPAPGRQWSVSTSGGAYPRWSPNGKELYYVAPDGTLLAASVAANGDPPDVGKPVALFRTRIVAGGAFLVGSRQQYDVDSDGRFLINVETESSPPPITLVLNWKPAVK